MLWASSPSPAGARPGPRPPGVRYSASKRVKANRLLKVGSEKMEIGLYTEALSRFQAAYELVPSPKISYNIAQAYNYMARFVEALHHFERFVRDYSDHSHKYWKAAKDIWIPRLKAKIATVAVQVNVAGAAVTVDGRDAGVSPHTRPIRLQPQPGRLFVIVVSKAGYVERTLKVKLRAGERLRQRVTLITEARALAQRAEFQREQAERKRMQLRLQREQEASLRRQIKRQHQLRWAGWITLGAGLAVGLAGGVAGIISLVDKAWVEGAEAGRPFSELNARYERAGLLRQVAWAGIGTGLAVAATGGILLWLGYRRSGRERARSRSRREAPRTLKPAVSVLPVLGPGQAGMTFGIRF